MSEMVYYGNDFFTYKNRLYYIDNEFMRGLIKDKGIDYCVEEVGITEVFDGISDWDGDPWCEVSQHAEFNPELLFKFLSEVKKIV